MNWYKTGAIIFSTLICLAYSDATANAKNSMDCNDFVGVYEQKKSVEGSTYIGTINIKTDGISYYLDASSSLTYLVNGEETASSCGFTAQLSAEIIEGKDTVFTFDDWEDESMKPPTITVEFGSNKILAKNFSDDFTLQPYFCGNSASFAMGEFTKKKK